MAGQLVAGTDYPGTWQQCASWFPDDAACAAYLAWLRWPVPRLRAGGCVASGRWALVDVRGVWPQDVGDGGHDLRGHAHAAADVVHGRLVGDQPESRG